VGAGALLVNGSLTSAVNVTSGAALGGSGTITGNVTVASGGGLRFNVTTGGVTGLAIHDNLALNGTINVTPTMVSGSLTSGTYTIATYTGTLSGTPTFVWTPPPGGTQTATFDTTSTPGVIKIHINTPAITSATTATGTVGSAFSYTITASNSPTSYNATGLPSGLSVNTSTGVISGTPTATGTSTVTISATNAGGTGTATLTLTINPPAPVISSAATATGTTGTAFSYTITASNSPTSFNATGLLAGLSINTSTGVISGTPTATGSYTVTLNATNAGGTSMATLALTVNPPAPAITSTTTATGTVGTAFGFTITASNSPTSFNATGLPTGLSVNTTTGVISGTPTATGTSTVTISATNAGGTGTATMTLTVNSSGSALTTSMTATGTVGTAFSYTITGNNSPTSFTALGLPSGLSINSSTGVISGTPTSSGNYGVFISATSAEGTTSGLLTLTVANIAPVITSPTIASATVGILFSYTIQATDNPTSYSASSLPGGLSFNSATGIISGIPTNAGVGTTTVTLGAINPAGTGSATLNITVNANAPPVISSLTTASAAVGQSFSYQIVSTYNPTFYSANPLPQGISLNSTTGVISGTPAYVGTTTVQLGASNVIGTGTATLTLTVLPQGAPVITSSTSLSIPVGSYGYYDISASNSPSSYSATFGSTGSSLPSWITFNSTYGILQFNYPPSLGTYTINLGAGNAIGTGMATLTVTVVPGSAPYFSSASDSATVGEPYIYAINAENYPSSYSATGLPLGLEIDPIAGIISGTPWISGTFPIQISASNSVGTHSAIFTLTTAANASPIVAYATVNQPFSYPVTTAANGFTFSATGLPSGFSINPTTGVITGTPTAVGTPNVIVTASNSVQTVSRPLIIAVQAGGTGNVTSTITFQPGSPVASYQPTKAGIEHLATSTYYDNQTSYGYMVGQDGSWSYRTLLGFDLSMIPTGAAISSVSLQDHLEYGYSTPVELYQATGAFGQASATWSENSFYQPALLSTLNSSSWASQTWASSANFIGAVQDAVSNTNPLYLILLSNEAESSTSNSDIYYIGNSPLLTLTYTTSSPPVIMNGATLFVTSGKAFNYQFNAINVDNNTTYSVDPSSTFPSGLSLSSSGLISGTTTAVGAYQVTIDATNANGIGSVTFALNVGNPPSFPANLNASATVGSSFSYTIPATNTPTSYSASGLPWGLSLNSQTGVISGTPNIDTASSYSVTITATNIYGTTTSSLVLNVSPVAPVLLNSSPLTFTVNQSVPVQGLSVGASFNGQPTSYSLSTNLQNLGLTIDSYGNITGTPNAAGTFSGSVTASNSGGTSPPVSLTVQVVPLPLPVIPAQTVTRVIGLSFLYTVQATIPTVVDSTQPSPTFTATGVTGLPGGLSFDFDGSVTGTPGTIYGTPTDPITTNTNYPVTVTATDSAGSSTTVINIELYPQGEPGINSIVATAQAGQGFDYEIDSLQNSLQSASATGPNGSALPNGLSYSFNGYNGISFTGCPTTPGTYPITITFTDSSGNITTDTLILTVTGVASTSQVGVPFTYTTPSAGPSTTPTTYTDNGTLPYGLTIDPQTGIVSGMIPFDNAGTYFVYLTATNAYGTTNTPLVLTVAPSAPVLQPGYPQSLSWFLIQNNTGINSSINQYFDGQPTSYSLSIDNYPDGIPGISLNVTDRTQPDSPTDFSAKLSGAATTNAAPGTYTGEITASNSAGSVSIPVVFQIYPAGTPGIRAPNSSVSINTGSPGQNLNNYFGFTAKAREGQSFNYELVPVSRASVTSTSATGLPAGLTYTDDGSYGYISGIPTIATELNSPQPITLTINSSSGVSSTATLFLTVTGITSASAVTAPVGQPFSFHVTDNDTPTHFAASAVASPGLVINSSTQLPRGLTINSSTGVISGTPTVVETVPITLTVTDADGTVTSTLTLTLTPASTDTVANFQQGVSPSASFTVPSATIAYDSQNSSVASSPVASTGILAVGQTSATATSEALLDFDLSSLPFDAVITSATLMISPSSANSTGSPVTLTLNQASGPFSAGTATWNNNSNINYNYNTGSLGTVMLDPANLPTTASFSLTPSFTQLIQQILDANSGHLYLNVSGSSNGGAPGGDIGFFSGPTTPSQNPVLIVTYVVVPAAPIITSSSALKVNVGQPLNYTLTETNNSTSTSVSGYTLTESDGSQSAFISGLPPGLTYTDDGRSGVLSGSPTTPETYNITLNATNPDGTGTATLVLTVPGILSATTATAQVGVPFSFQVDDNAQPYYFSATGLPAGLQIDSTTGVISGTATVADTLPISLIVYDQGGVETGNLLLTINAKSSDSRLNFQEGVSPGVSYTVPSVTIANDLANPAVANQNFNSDNNLIVGQTSATASSRALLGFDLSALPPNATITSAYLVMQTNTASGNATGVPLSVEVHQAGVPFTPATANWANNNLYASAVLSSLTLDPSATASSQTFPLHAAFTKAVQQAYNNSSPLYLTLLAPTAEGGTSPDFIRFVTNATNPSQNPQLVVTYEAPPAAPYITSAGTVTGTVNIPLNYTITALYNPQTFAASGLPVGLSLNSSTGVISGTVTTVGSTVATVSATNTTGTGSQAVTFNIDSATPATSLQIVSGNNQIGPPDSFLAQPLVVQADYNGAPLPNALVTFSASPGQGGFAQSSSGNSPASTTLTAVTNGSGQAAVYYLLPQSLGTTTLQVKAGTAQPISFTETASPDASIGADSLAILSVLSGEGQSGSADQPLPQPFIIQATNAAGQPVSGLALSLNVIQGGGAISSGSGGGMGAALNVTTDSFGQATIYLAPGGGNGTTNTVSCAPSSGDASSTIYLTALTQSTSTSNPQPGGGTAPKTDTDPGPPPGSPSSGQIVITPKQYTDKNGNAPNGDSGIYLPSSFYDPVTKTTYPYYPDYTNITISWPEMTGATGYTVYRMDDTGTWTSVGTTSSGSTITIDDGAKSATKTTLNSGIDYQYLVMAQTASSDLQVGLTSYTIPLIAAIAWQNNAPGGDQEWYEYAMSSGGYYGYWWNSAGVYQQSPNQGGNGTQSPWLGTYKFILNPTKTASTFTWYEEGWSGSQYAPTYAPAVILSTVTSPTNPSNPSESATQNGNHPYAWWVVVGSTVNDYQAGDSALLDLFDLGRYGIDQSAQTAGGPIPQGGIATFYVDRNNYNICFHSTTVITYTGDTGAFTLTDESGNSISSGASDNYYNNNQNGPDFYDGVTVTPTSSAQYGDTITITVSDADQDGGSFGTQTFTYTFTGSKDLSIPIDEASGSRYRKIALNGLPMADEKPQQSAESDQEKEETYIDALTLGLRHSTTDVYTPVSGSDFSVSARRDFRSQVWNNRNGLRPHEQPDLPFGTCWSSNLAPNIKFAANNDPQKKQPDQAIVTDETGAVHTFAVWYSANPTPPNGTTTYTLKFFPMPTAKNEAQAPNLETLTANTSTTPVTYTFTRKYGTTLVYQSTGLAQRISNDRVKGSAYSTIYQYARLIQAKDRVGNIVSYQFQGPTNLVPDSITVANQPGIKLSIEQQPLSALISGSTSTQSVITAIWDANGNKTTYGYSAAPGDTDAAELTSVTTSDGATTNYTYSAQSEADLTPHASSDPGSTYWYADIASITDPLRNTYKFSYVMDHSKDNYMDNPQVYTGYYTQSGSPRDVSLVTMPDTTTASFVNTNNQSPICLYSSSNGGLTVSGPRSSQVTDATGFTRTYTFTNSQVVPLPKFPDPVATSSTVASKVIAWQNLTIAYGNLGSETFQFDINAAMALKQITDFSGNVTAFAHTDPWTAPPDYAAVFGATGAPINGFYDDPTSQTDALSHAKIFTYYGANRIMQSSTDENGNKTYYDIDSLGRRTSEKLYDSGGNLVQETEFAYGNSKYPGFMTQKTVQALGGSDPSWTKSLVTQYTPDANGRVAQEIVDPGTLNLVTTYTYDANGNKLTATDPKGHTTWFSYDLRNRLVTTTFADGGQKQFVYDARGNKVTEYDENGIATLYAYDALSRLSTQTRNMNGSGANLVTSYTYNAVNCKLSTTDPNGGVTAMQYDNLQRVTQITDALSHVTQFTYGANSGGNVFDSSSFKPTHTVDPRGFATDVAFDALYRPITKAVQYGGASPSTTSTQYDNVGNAILVTDPLGHQTGTTYDALNRPLVTTYADHSTTQASYTSTGFKWQVIDPNGNKTQTAYDTAGRAISVTQGYGTSAAATTATAYDAAGNVAETVNPLGNKWDYVYDARNRKVQELEPAVIDATSNTTSRPTLTWQYDLAGRVIATIDARGNETNTHYDPANRVIEVDQPAVSAGTPKTFTTYDKNGNVLTLTDPNGHTTTNTYDALNRLLTSTDAANITVTNTWDQVGNKLTVEDGNNHTTTFTYDGLNRNTSVTDAAGHATTFQYDAMNKTQRIDALGQTTTYLYDVRNRLSNVVYASGAAANSQRNYAYDNVGNLLSVTEPNKTAANVVYAYDPLNRAVSETSNGQTHAYVYDLAGNRLQTTYGGTGRIITSTYDALNRLSAMTESGRTTGYGYDLNGNIAQKTAPNGDTEAYSFDALNRATIESAQTGGAVSLFTYQYGYDLVGNVLTVNETYTSGLGNRLVTNTYDAINRLDVEAVTGSSSVTTTYAYDGANNRTSKVITGTGADSISYSYNNLNQLTSYGDGTRSVTLTYDADGNRATRVVSGSSDAGTDAYSYDFENRLIGLAKGTGGGTGTYAYTYDYRTRRIVRDESNAGGVVTNLVFSGGTSVQEYAGTTPSLTVEYIRGSDYGGGVGGILYTLRGGTPSYTHENRRGDVVAKTDGSGSLTYQAQYEAFGNQVATSGSTLDRQKSNSKDTDPTGLVDEGFRYRDLETGMFINRDPAGFVDGPNLYTYVIQNPWTKFDPEGLAGDDPEGVVRKDHHVVPVATLKKQNFSKDVIESLEDQKVPAGKSRDMPQHVFNDAHSAYNKRAAEITDQYVKLAQSSGVDPSGLSGKDAKEFSEKLVEQINADPYCGKFNQQVAAGATGEELNKMYGESSKLLESKAALSGELLKGSGSVMRAISTKLGPLGDVAMGAFFVKDVADVGVNQASLNLTKSVSGYDVVIQPVGDKFNRSVDDANKGTLKQGDFGAGLFGNDINTMSKLENGEDPSK